MESLEWTHWNGEYWTRFHLEILSWREAHGSRGRKGMARGPYYGISWGEVGSVWGCGGGGWGVELLGGGGGASPATPPPPPPPLLDETLLEGIMKILWNHAPVVTHWR